MKTLGRPFSTHAQEIVSRRLEGFIDSAVTFGSPKAPKELTKKGEKYAWQRGKFPL